MPSYSIDFGPAGGGVGGLPPVEPLPQAATNTSVNANAIAGIANKFFLFFIKKLSLKIICPYSFIFF
jgi:hypothetical protein